MIHHVMTYRGFRIELNRKPIPDRRHDYDWLNPDIDENACGTASSVIEAHAYIDDYLAGEVR